MSELPVVIITGASSGIGRAAAISLAQRGDVRLALVGRSRERLDDVATQCGQVEVLTIPLDLGSSANARLTIDHVLERWGRLDTLIVNAGLYLGGDMADADPVLVDELLGINVTGSIQLVRAALPHMKQAGCGDILIVTSVAGYQDIHWEPVYSASKHAMVSFTHTLRKQLVGTGIRVMSIGPGVVLTELWGYGQDEDDRIATEVEARRGIEVQQVIDAILFMLDRPAHVTIRDLVILPTDQDI